MMKHLNGTLKVGYNFYKEKYGRGSPKKSNRKRKNMKVEKHKVCWLRASIYSVCYMGENLGKIVERVRG